MSLSGDYLPCTISVLLESALIEKIDFWKEQKDKFQEYNAACGRKCAPSLLDIHICEIKQSRR